MKQRLMLCIVVLLVSGVARPLRAAGTSGIRSLAGLTVVRVLVEDLNLATQKTGLRKEQLQALAEEQLSHTGITVLRPQERAPAPLVYIRLSAVIGRDSEKAPMSFYLVVQVKQLAMLTRELSVTSPTTDVPATAPLLVTTWESGTMVMLDRTELFFYMRHTLTNLLGELLRDYREANGRKSEEKKELLPFSPLSFFSLHSLQWQDHSLHAR